MQARGRSLLAAAATRYLMISAIAPTSYSCLLLLVGLDSSYCPLKAANVIILSRTGANAIVTLAFLNQHLCFSAAHQT